MVGDLMEELVFTMSAHPFALLYNIACGLSSSSDTVLMLPLLFIMITASLIRQIASKWSTPQRFHQLSLLPVLKWEGKV